MQETAVHQLFHNIMLSWRSPHTHVWNAPYDADHDVVVHVNDSSSTAALHIDP